MMRNTMKRILSAAALLAASVGTTVAAQGAPLLLKSGRIDVGAKTASAVAPMSTSATAVQTTKYIIQHDGKIPASWRRTLEKSGAKILRYIPENAYLISVTADALRAVRATVDHVTLLPYRKAYRIDPKIKLASLASAAAATNVAIYAVSLFSADARADYVEKIGALPGCRVIRSGGTVIRAALTASGVDEVAAFDEIEYVAPWVKPQLHNNVAVQAPRMNVETVWPGGASTLGLTGAGQVVAVADTGLDTGDLTTVHEDVRGRITRTYARGRANDWSDPHGHGTHVAGSVLGGGNKSSSPKIRGVAYGASLIFQSLLDSDGGLNGLPDDLNELFDQSYQDEDDKAGARIHSNSWGAGTAGQYTVYSRQVDEFCFAHPDMFILFSAGNDGADVSPCDGVIDEMSVGAPATAKNCLAVGASENYRTTGGYSTYGWGELWPSDYSKKPIRDDYVSRPADGLNQGMAAFSSRGPCEDGRIKPDIVAPGTDILSMRSSVGETMWGWYNQYYQYCGGTSMSCPLVAGASTLVRQWLVENRGIADPDGATIKALFAAGATSLTPGQYGADAYREIPGAYPNNVEGWGQVNLGKSLSSGGDDVHVYDAQVIGDGEAQTNMFTVAAAGGRIAFVMAYADAPAALSSAKQLVNDLDLTVVSPSGTVYYPNSLDEADRLNNVEGVRIDSAEAGTYKVIVTGYDVNTGMDVSLTGGKENAIRYSLVVNAIGDAAVSAVTVTGSANVTGGKSATYTCTASCADGTVRTVKPTWSVIHGSAFASIDANGVLTASSVSETQNVTLEAVYGGKSATFAVSIAKQLTVNEALNNTNLTFTTGGASPWFVQTEETHDGVAALQSGAIGNNQTSWVETTVTGPGRISFWWYVSSESVSFDYLSFAVDGEPKRKIGGTDCDWTNVRYVVPEGEHTLRWAYRKDVSESYGLDAGFLDEVVWESGEFDPEPCTVYVSADYGDDDNDGQDESLPKRTIQAAIDAVADGSTIIVGSGEYGPIVTTNRLLTIRSEYGAYSTVIDGGGMNRCADLGSEVRQTNTVLIGFMLQNGSASHGGGAYGGCLRRCILKDNSAQWGGGAHSSTLSNCLLYDNSAAYGGGANGCRLFNCTLSRNEASEEGGGVVTGGWETRNCIVSGNEAPENGDVSGGNCAYTCAGVLLSGAGNICADPRFFDSDADDFTLRYDSPCLDAGDNESVDDDLDLSDWTRILNGIVDMGAYEGFWLDAPTDVTASDGTSTETVTITWSPVEGATGYAVYRTETEEFNYWNYEYLGWTDDTSFEDAECNAGMTYWYWIGSVSGREDGWGKLSDGDSGSRLALFPYEIEDDGAVITGYNGTETSIVIPDEIDGYPVTGIAEGAFRGLRRMRKVTIPDSMRTIGAYAFENCTGLTSVVIPDGVESVGEGAFTGCTGLKTVTVPQCVCTDGLWYSFDWDTITKVIVADGVTEIAAGAFAGCYALTGVTLPSSLESIGDQAFAECYALKRVKIPDGVETLGAGIFLNCYDLEGVTLPNGLTEIPESMFAGCSSLATVNIPVGLIDIHDHAFDGCTVLSRLEIPAGLCLIGNSAFADSGLTSVEIPDITEDGLGEGAFYGCINLDSVTIPAAVFKIGLSYLFDTTLRADVIVADGVTEIPAGAFADFNYVTGVELPEGVSQIPDNAFEGLAGLKTVSLPASVVGIGTRAFADCGKLSDIVCAGNAPTSVGVEAFTGVKSSCTVWVNKGSTGWGSVPGTWQGMKTAYLSSSLCLPSLSSTSANVIATHETGGGWTVESASGSELTQSDLDSLRVFVTLNGEEVETTAGYRTIVSPDGTSAVLTLKTPEVATAAEVGEEKDETDPSGMLIVVDASAIDAKPTPQAGESVGALPAKTVKGLWYQASWGNDINSMTQGAKVQATGDSLYLGVIKQTGNCGFYRTTVSEK